MVYIFVVKTRKVQKEVCKLASHSTVRVRKPEYSVNEQNYEILISVLLFFVRKLAIEKAEFEI